MRKNTREKDPYQKIGSEFFQEGIELSELTGKKNTYKIDNQVLVEN